MKFKDLKVGDTIYVKNPISQYKPIKKTIGLIIPYKKLVPLESFESHSERLDFYGEDGDFLGAAMPNCSQGIGIGNMIFADFAAFKQYWIDYHKNIIKNLDYDIDRLREKIRLANDDLEMVNVLQDEE